MLKKIGFSSAALLAMLTCVQPAALSAEGRGDVRHNDGYTEQHNVRDGDRDRDRDRDRAQYRDNDDWYRYNSFRR